MKERVKELFDLKDRIEELNRENQIANQEKQTLEHNVQSIKRCSVDLCWFLHSYALYKPLFIFKTLRWCLVAVVITIS